MGNAVSGVELRDGSIDILKGVYGGARKGP